MKETYSVEQLIIGKIYVCNNLGNISGPIQMLTNEQYIFEIKTDDVVEEVITGDTFKKSRKQYQVSNLEQNVYNHIFNKKYVVETQELKEYLNEVIIEKLDLNKELINRGFIEKWDLVRIYNELNFQLNNKQKMLQKK